MGKTYSFDLRNESKNSTIDVHKYLYILYKNRFFRNSIDQLVRSISSVSANIIEAQLSNSNKELARYYEISLKSGNESVHWFDILIETYDTTSNELEKFKVRLSEINRILAASIIKLRKK